MQNELDLNAKTEPESPDEPTDDLDATAHALWALIRDQQQAIQTLHETQKPLIERVDWLIEAVRDQAKTFIHLSDSIEGTLDHHIFLIHRPSDDGHGPGPERHDNRNTQGWPIVQRCDGTQFCKQWGAHSENHGDRQSECDWHQLYNDNAIRDLDRQVWMLEYMYYQVLARYGDPGTTLEQFAVHARNFGRQQRARDAAEFPPPPRGINIDLSVLEASATNAD
tara:strand:+ start:2906 stop:3574 length:669 start_codon:yes stop_codon:yes gene_type:complete